MKIIVFLFIRKSSKTVAKVCVVAVTRLAERHFTTPLDRTQGFGNENNIAFFSSTAKAKITS